MFCVLCGVFVFSIMISSPFAFLLCRKVPWYNDDRGYWYICFGFFCGIFALALKKNINNILHGTSNVIKNLLVSQSFSIISISGFGV